MNRSGSLALLASGQRWIRARNWWLVGATVAIVLGLLAVALIAMIGWLWRQAPAVVDAGNRLGGDAATLMEQAAPGIGERLDQWAPGVREQLSRAIPAVAPTPSQDVSGVDVGPVPRYPGLVRTHFVHAGQSVEVAYSGVAPFDAVLTHYANGFITGGYAAEVLAAAPGREQHRFRRERETIEFELERQSGGRIEVRLRQPAQP